VTDKSDLEPMESPGSQMPPIGIVDLMVLTAAMAFVFAIRDRMTQLGWIFHTDVLWFRAIEHVTFCLMMGLPLASFFRFVVQKRIVGRYLVEPGHWLLFAMGLKTCAQTFPILAMAMLGFSTSHIDSSNALLYFLPNAIVSLLSAWVLFRGSRIVGKWWKSILLLMVLIELVEAIQMLLILLLVQSFSTWRISSWISYVTWGDYVLKFGLCVCLFLLVIKELRKGPDRDFWHWIGALIPFVGCLIYPILSYVYSNYLFDPTVIP